MSKKVDPYIYRFILEVRFANKILNFIDNKGKILSHFNKETTYSKFKIEPGGTKIQLNSDDDKEIVFFGWENFGLQIESVDNFVEPISRIEMLNKLLVPYNELFQDNISRIGIKCSFLYHKKNKTIQDIKSSFKERFLKDSPQFETAIGASLTDFAYQFDITAGSVKSHLLFGPVTKAESIEKFFDNQLKLYNDFPKDHGLFIDIDSFVEKETCETINSDTWVDTAKANFAYSESVVTKFIDYIFANG